MTTLQAVVVAVDEGFGDSDASPSVNQTHQESMGIMVPSEPLDEGDSRSSTSSPTRNVVEEPLPPTNLHRRRVLVETDSAKRARLEL